jgi:hypothetical protein
MPSLDRVTLLVIGLLPMLPACVSTPQAEVGRSHSAPAVGPVLPAVQVARSTQAQSDEPPLAGADAVAVRPRDMSDELVIPVKAESDDPVMEPIRPSGQFEPKRPDPMLIEAVRCYLDKSPEQADRRLQGLDEADRHLLCALLPIAVQLGDGALTNAKAEDLAAMVENVQALLAPLRERAALEVPKLCFCRPVAAPARFGVYETIEENHLFRPGEVVGLYTEVRNFACAPHGSDFRTNVQTSIEVHNDHGEVVWRFDPPARTDPSLSPRQDYCHVGRFALPTNLPAGAYTLWLKVTDVPTGRTTRRSLDFRVTTVKDVRSGGVGG